MPPNRDWAVSAPGMQLVGLLAVPSSQRDERSTRWYRYAPRCEESHTEQAPESPSSSGGLERPPMTRTFVPRSDPVPEARPTTRVPSVRVGPPRRPEDQGRRRASGQRRARPPPSCADRRRDFGDPRCRGFSTTSTAKRRRRQVPAEADRIQTLERQLVVVIGQAGEGPDRSALPRTASRSTGPVLASAESSGPYCQRLG